MSRIIAWLGVYVLVIGCAVPMRAQGTQDYIPLWTNSTGTLGNSVMYQSGTSIGINTTAPSGTLGVNGSVSATTFNIGSNRLAFGTYSKANAFLGFAGNTTMTGKWNTASGPQALHANTTGTYNTASGYYALGVNTTGYENTASGAGALEANTTGANNTASGHLALGINTTGWGNTAHGDSALASNSTGGYNTASGVFALYYNSAGNYNTALGYSAGVPYQSNLSNATAIGALAYVTQNNSLVLGSVNGVNGATSNTAVGIGTTAPAYLLTLVQGGGTAMADAWSTWSSRRWKTNIQPLRGALATVARLRGVSYDLKANGKHQIGVIAEEVGAVVPEVVTWDKNGTEAQGVDYSRLTALLIEATKEQQALIHQQQEQIRLQQAQISELRSQVEAIQTSLNPDGQNSSELGSVKAQVPVTHP
jgi:trimeric autotransporter adhesin